MHIYEYKGIRLPSVTTVTSLLKDYKAFDAITRWANYLGFKHEKYNDVLNAKANFGTAVHETIHRKLVNEPITPDVYSNLNVNDFMDYKTTMKVFDKFYEEFSNPSIQTIYSEHSLANIELGYAGTVDWLVCDSDNKTALIDFKTSSDVRDHMPMQLAAYKELLEHENPNLKIDYCAILLIGPERYRLVKYSTGEINTSLMKFNAFLHILQDFYLEDMTTDGASDENTIIKLQDNTERTDE